MSTTKEAKIAFINPNSSQSAVVKTDSFEIGSQKSFRDFYFRAKDFFVTKPSIFLQLFIDGSDRNGAVYYDLDILRDDAVSSNFFGGEK